MTSARNSTNTPREYLGLNLRAIQTTAVGDVSIRDVSVETATGDVTVSSSLQTSASSQTSEALTESNQLQREPMPVQATPTESISLPPPSEASMQDYYKLQQDLLGLTVAFSAVIFAFVWFFYSWQIALDYGLGTCAGVVYLRMLGKNVSTIGRQKKNSSAGRLAVFAGMMIVALRWEQLAVIPVFLGFLTYKAAIIAFVLWTSVLPERRAT